MEHIEETFGLGRKGCQIQDWSRPTGEERLKKQSFSRTWWISVTWRTPNLQNTCRNTRGESCSWWQDTEQDSQSKARQLHRRQRPKLLDTISKLLGMAGETSDAGSAYTRVKTPWLVRLPEEECPEIWIRIPPRRWPTRWDKIHPLASLIWERKVEELLDKHGWEKYRNGSVFTRTKSSDDSYLSTWVNDIKMLGIRPMWKSQQKDIDLDDPTPYVRSSVCGMHAKVDDQAVQSKTELFKKVTTTGEADEKKKQTKESIRREGSLQGAVTWTVMQKSALRDTANHLRQMYHLSSRRPHRAETITWYPPEDDETTGRSSLPCVLKLFCNVCIWQELDDQMYYGQLILWHDPWPNRTGLATKDCWGWSVVSIQPKTTWNSVMLEIILKNASLVCSKLPNLQVTRVRDSKSTSGGVLCVFGSHTVVPISWTCKKQSAGSHSSAESETNSLDAGLRMDGLPALQFWRLCWKRFPVSQPKETLSIINAHESFLLIHSTMFWPTFPTVLIQSNSTSQKRNSNFFSRTGRRWCEISARCGKKRSLLRKAEARALHIMFIGPGSEETWKCEKIHPITQKGKWDEFAG